MKAKPTMLLFATLTIMVIAAASVGCGEDSTSGSRESATNTEVSPGTSSNSDSEARSGSEALTTSSLSKPEFLKQANTACSQETKGLLQKAETYMNTHRTKELPEGRLIVNMAKAVVLPTVEAQSDVIRRLGVPAGDEEEIEAILTNQQKGIDEIKKLKEAQSTTEVIEDHIADADEELEDYGLTAC